MVWEKNFIVILKIKEWKFYELFVIKNLYNIIVVVFNLYKSEVMVGKDSDECNCYNLKMIYGYWKFLFVMVKRSLRWSVLNDGWCEI